MSGPSQDLGGWLERIERVHPRAIEMGLDRVVRVRDALRLGVRVPIITVGGTNGKGSVCAFLEAILHEAGYKVGCYTSPHLTRYNERVRIGRAEAADDMLVRAFEAVDAARGETPLTYFEFGTLAAVWLFLRESVDVAVLEVGLGGRLDAVNAFDADCSVLTTIALDHMEYLGDTREAVGFEKAGIFRAGRPAVCGDADPPRSVSDHARALGANLLVSGRDFGFDSRAQHWSYWGPHGRRHGLPHPALRGDYQIANAATSLAALDTLREVLPVAANDIRAGLLTVENPGRLQVLAGRPTVVLDVAHNPAAADALARNLGRMPRARRTLAVFSMLKDKDIRGVIEAVKPRVDEWLVAAVEGARAADVARLQSELAQAGVQAVIACATIADAYAQAQDRAAENDRIVVFGSFYTVAAAIGAHESVRQATRRRTPKPGTNG